MSLGINSVKTLHSFYNILFANFTIQNSMGLIHFKDIGEQDPKNKSICSKNTKSVAQSCINSQFLNLKIIWVNYKT